MEALSNVNTILGMVHDILAAVETASQNKSRCDKVAKRVRCIMDILEAAAAAAQDDGTTSLDAATWRLMDRLKKALSNALQVVRQCQGSNDSFLCVFAGGQMAAHSLDEVEHEINECILDLTFANSLRLETLLVHRKHNDVVAVANNNSISEKDDEKKRKNKGRPESVLPDKMMMDHVVDNTTMTTAAVGVPVSMVTTAAVHDDYWSNERLKWQSVFSDENPNAYCSIM